MKKFFIIVASLILFVSISIAEASTLGKILLQVEENGEAWYVNPESQRRYYLGRPKDAFDIMRLSGVGISNSDLNKIPAALGHLGRLDSYDSDGDGFDDATEIKSGYDPTGDGKIITDTSFAKKHLGKIFLQVENKGEAWYIDPDNAERYYLGRPMDAFNIMRDLGLGITDQDLDKISEGDINNLEQEIAEAPEGSILIDVPFSPQAPFRNWADPRQQDGCEEVSALMAVRWARGEGLTKQEALDEIFTMAEYQEEKYGHYHDTSARDTIDRIFKDYFDFNDLEYKEDVSKEDVINALKNGQIVVVPINGMTVGNIYYTQPGPPRHMLVVKGYDANRDVFITNDPGVGCGDSFEYPADRFYSSIRDYPTGVHTTPTEEKKVMIVVNK
ncbi:hypothetical protein GF382_00990 [Candidatus Falkowbacteria bacterium]|nr:hypothetical protein [Candidatus Falkowbacteria bacterium]